MKNILRRDFSPLSINTYGLLFIGLTLILFSLIVSYSYYQIKTIETAASNRTNYLARNELSRLVLTINEELQSTASTFIKWEEVSQQIDNPTYYSYWQRTRLSQASFMPAYFKSVELYNRDGKPLSTEKISIVQLTDQLRKEKIYINPEKNTVYQISRIQSESDEAKGYAILEYNLEQILRRIHFQYIDATSIRYKDQGVTFPLDKINQHIEYDITTNDAFDSLQSVILTTVLQLAAAAALISLALWVIISVFSGRPLKSLAKHIDSLGIDDYRQLEKRFGLLRTTREYETVRNSFNRFQELLKQSNSALKLSESRLQSVLENIGVGIITFTPDLNIDSSNVEAQKIFSYTESELDNCQIDQLLIADSKESFRYYIDKVMQQDSSLTTKDSIELIGTSSTGDTFEISINISRVNVAGGDILIAMIRDISNEKRASEKLEQMANYDALTTLPNRVLFQDRLNHAIEQAHRGKHRVGLMFLDLDRFKMINDTLGHHIGDQLLVQVAQRLRECIREGDTVARLGGDEFTVINEHIESNTESLKVAARINEEMRQPFILEDQEHFIATSIGITFYPDDAQSVDELIRHADAAMYKAKENGGDGYQLFTADISDTANQRMYIESRLRHAIDNHEFEVLYQPRINLQTREITSFEALLRWNDRERHQTSAAEFIPILEDTGMIINVGNWVLNEVCLQIKHWQQTDVDFKRIAINLSSRQFKHKYFIDDIDSILYTHGIRPEHIEFEITESLLIDNVEDTQEILGILHQRGFHISIDDFGTGYSSLSYLKQFPIDTIKIDQYFLKSYPEDKSDIAIVESIIAIADNLDMSVTAEGIENEQQLEFLRSCHCGEAQGYYFARPMPAATVQAWVIQYRKSLIDSHQSIQTGSVS